MLARDASPSEGMHQPGAFPRDAWLHVQDKTRDRTPYTDSPLGRPGGGQPRPLDYEAVSWSKNRSTAFSTAL